MLFRSLLPFTRIFFGVLTKSLLVALLGYVVLRFLPGSPFEEENMGLLTNTQRQALGLENSQFFAQFFSWLQHVLRGQFYSSYFDRPDIIQRQLAAAFGSTVSMMCVTVSGTVFMSLCLLKLITRLSEQEQKHFNTMTNILLSVPTYVLVGFALITLIFVRRTFGLSVEWPFYLLGLLTLFFRPSLVVFDVLKKKMDTYRTTALDQALLARGLERSVISFRHFGKIALSPTLGAISPWVSQMVMGQLTVEYMLGWNGVGRYLIQSYQSRDFSLALSLTVWLCFLFFILDSAMVTLRERLDPRLIETQNP